MIAVPHIAPQVELGTLGMADTLILMVLALVVFGPRKLPQLGRQLGKLMYEFRKASNDFKFQMEEELRLSEESERKKKLEGERTEQQRLEQHLAVPKEYEADAAALAAQQASSTPSTESHPVSSPYAGEGVYPPVGTSVETPSAETETPKIQPPSTGETVAKTSDNKPENAEAVSQNG